MYVLAATGTQCPMEGNPRKYITDNGPVNVPETPYYTRLIGDGSLVPAAGSGSESAVTVGGAVVGGAVPSAPIDNGAHGTHNGALGTAPPTSPAPAPDEDEKEKKKNGKS